MTASTIILMLGYGVFAFFFFYMLGFVRGYVRGRAAPIDWQKFDPTYKVNRSNLWQPGDEIGGPNSRGPLGID